MKLTQIFALILFLSLPILVQSQVIRPFNERASFNTNGNIALIGNTLMTCEASANCSDTQAGIANTNNNDLSMVFINTDTAAGLSNSSQATLSMPQGAQVLFAGLYWGSRADVTNSNRGTIQIKRPGQANYNTVLADQLDTITSRNTPDSRPYQAMADVTTLVQSGGNGNYIVGGLTGLTGNIGGGGTFGGWSLAVIYQDSNQPFRRLMLFDGAADVGGQNDVSINVNGLLTPTSGTFDTYLGALSWEGDAGISGDAFTFEGTTLDQTINTADNFWNSSISYLDNRVTQKSPDYVNQLGMDVDMVDVSNLLANGATDADILFSSSGDGYYPHYLSFVTELYLPDFSATLSKTVVDLNGGNIIAGDVIEYTISFKNSGQEGATNTVLTDLLPDHLNYVPNSMVISQSDVGGTGAQSDATGDDLADYDATQRILTFRLGDGANDSKGGSFQQNQGSTVTFQATVDQNAPYGDIVNTARIVSNSAVFPNQDFAAEDTATITLGDFQAPAIPVITSPVDGALLNTNQPIVSGTAEPGATINVTGPNGEHCQTVVNPGGGWSCQLDSALPEGANTIEVTATDTAGNTSSAANVDITVDTVAPIPAVCTVSPDPANNGTEITATCTGVETGGSVSIPGYSCSAESNGEVICTGIVGTDGVDGDETATTYDQAGNSSQSPATFTLDNIAPADPSITSPTTGTVTNNTQPTVSGSGEVGSTVTVTATGGQTCIAVVDNNGLWSCTFSQALPDGEQLITATASDDAGNQSGNDSITLTIDSSLAYQLNVTTNGDLETTEAGGTDSFTLSLPLTPTADVTVNLHSDDTGEFTVSPSSVTFTPSNWNTAVTITVTGVDDTEYDLDQSVNLIIDPLSSADANYHGINPDDLTVTNLDDDERPDLNVFITNCIDGIKPASNIQYQVMIQNTGNKNISNATVTTDLGVNLLAGTWLCEASGSSNCAQNSGTGNLNEPVDLNVGEMLIYDIDTEVIGAETDLAEVVATITLPAGETDVTPNDNTAYDNDIIYTFLFKDGFECAAPGTLESAYNQLLAF